MTQYLSGYTSAESAYLVNDYPYGFRLRCKIRYWLEYNPKHGFRLVSQTTNPKRAGEPWNKPKASTYCNGPSFLTRNDETGYISWAGFHLENLGAAKANDLLINHGEKLPREFLPELQRFIATKREYDRLLATGMNYQEASFEATRRTLPAATLKSALRTGLTTHFANKEPADRFTRLTLVLQSGTIGELEDFLSTFNMSITSFKDGVIDEKI